MAEGIYTLPEKPEYHSAIRRLKNSDPANADAILNPLILALLENTEFVRLLVQALADRNAADHTAIRKETAQSIQSAVESVPLPDVSGAIGAHNVSADAHPEQFAGKVPAARKINGKPLTSDITLSASDVGARDNKWNPTAAQVGAVPTSRKINGKPLTADIALTADDVKAVPDSRTVNGKALTQNIKIPFFAAQKTAPSDTGLLWIDTTAGTGGLKYYNGSAWVHVPVAYT